MKRFWYIAISIVLICALGFTLVACDFVDDILGKAQQIVEDLESELEEEAQSTDNTGDNAEDNAGGRTEDKTDVTAKTGDQSIRERFLYEFGRSL